MSRMSKRKGARGEREAAAALRAIGIDGARRGRQYHGGPESPDVVAIPGVHVEVKRVERLNLAAAMKQADAERGPTDVPVVLSKRNRGPWLLTVKVEDVPDLFTALDRAFSEPGLSASLEPSGAGETT